MFRTLKAKSHKPFSFDIAADKILLGWKSAGEPILSDDQPEESQSSIEKTISCKDSDIPKVKEDSYSFDPPIEDYRLETNFSIAILLKHAHTLVVI